MTLLEPLLQPWHEPGTGLETWKQTFRTAADELCGDLGHSLTATTDAAFIRSEVNGRRSRRIVLFAFFCTDVIGATLWATWCESWWGRQPGAGAMEGARGVEDSYEHRSACSSLGINHFVLLVFSVPVEGVMFYLAGRNPWSFWSDGLLLPVWLIRLGLFDVLLWNVPPQTLVGDALWFCVMAVMCRVHSMALGILVVSQVLSLLLVFQWHGTLKLDTFDHVRYGIYTITMLIIMAGAYLLDEQSRLRSFSELMSLQDNNAALAERLLRWKVLPESPSLHPADMHSIAQQFGDPLPGQGFLQATAAEAAVATAIGQAASSDSAEGSGPAVNEGAMELGAAAVAGTPRPAHVLPPPRSGSGRGSAGSARSVRFALPQDSGDCMDSRCSVPTTRPSAGAGLSLCPPVAMSLMDAME